TAMAFGNAIRNSVATLGGPASANDLARLLFTDFGDEMASRDEILKAADDPTVSPVSNLSNPSMPRPRAPTQPPPIPMSPRSGEFGTAQRGRQDSSLLPAVPSMIVQPGSGAISTATPLTPVPATPVTPAASLSMPGLMATPPSGVLDLTANVPADTWMANPDTDLLRAHRWRSLRNVGIAVGGIGVLVIAAIFAVKLLGNSDAGPSKDGLGNITPDAALAARDAAQTVADSGPNRDDIVALSRFGFFSIDASAKTTIWIDNKNIGETPLTRLPLAPGPHKVKAVGPRGKKPREFTITIYGGRDTEEPLITW
nr:hypothetical protein [Deltaproteobacteria bacterium]